jgi:hypothetical protein
MVANGYVEAARVVNYIKSLTPRVRAFEIDVAVVKGDASITEISLVTDMREAFQDPIRHEPLSRSPGRRGQLR